MYKELSGMAIAAKLKKEFNRIYNMDVIEYLLMNCNRIDALFMHQQKLNLKHY